MPALTRTADLYEHCVAMVYTAAGVTSILQSNVIDKRLDSTVCGVATMIGTLDTTTLYNQIQADLSGFKAGEQATFTTWANGRMASIDAWIATEQNDFLVWFAQVQSTLGNDAAGNLLNMIAKYKSRQTTVTIAVADWALSNGVYVCTKTVSIVPANCTLHASPAWASRAVYQDAEAGVSAAEAGSVTFTATSLPTAAVTVNIAVSEVDA